MAEINECTVQKPEPQEVGCVGVGRRSEDCWNTVSLMAVPRQSSERSVEVCGCEGE